jgi:PAS domain S-box-containing protein
MSYENKNGQEIEITEKDMIVSTTDRKGIILYANDMFCTVAGYDRKDIIGQPHNMIRHPEMPRVIFKLLWDRVIRGEMLYAFVKNISRNGDYYWVKAYVKPVMQNGAVVKITSYRKPLNEYAKNIIIDLYAALLQYEQTHSVDESLQYFLSYLEERDFTYDQFVDKLSLEKNVKNIAIRNIDFNKEKNNHIIYKEYIVNSINNKQFKELEKANNEVCTFANWIEDVSSESFSQDSAWKKVVSYHEKFHSSLNEFIQKSIDGNSSNNSNSLLRDLDDDIKNIFANLTIVRDKY